MGLTMTLNYMFFLTNESLLSTRLQKLHHHKRQHRKIIFLKQKFPSNIFHILAQLIMGARVSYVEVFFFFFFFGSKN